MKLAVHIKGPGYDDRAELCDDRAECLPGQPVLVLRGKVLGIAELPLGTRIEVVWRKGRTDPVRAMVQKAIDAGYPINMDQVG